MTNITKLLKDAPKDMKLYSPLFGEVKFKYINGSKFGIVVEDSEECYRSFDKYGRYFTIYDNAECLLFPSKDCRTWEGWKMPAKPNFKVGDWLRRNTLSVHPILVKDYSEQQGYKVEGLGLTYYIHQGVVDNKYHLWTIQDAKDGDVLIDKSNGREGPFIFKETKPSNIKTDVLNPLTVLGYCGIGGAGFTKGSGWGDTANCTYYPATKEQRDLLFQKMSEAGYEWDADKKELRKVKEHYDIKKFHAGMPVLVRDNIRNKWLYTLFGMYNKDNVAYPFVVVDMRGYAQCIPFNEDTKHLLGTTDMPSEEFINW